MPRIATALLASTVAAFAWVGGATAQDQAPPVAAAVLDPSILPIGDGQAYRRLARRWVGEIVETRYTDEAKRETAYLVRWRADDPAAVPYRDLDSAIGAVFDDPGLKHGEAWASNGTKFRAFSFGDTEAAMACVGFSRDEAGNEGTFAVHCAGGTKSVDAAAAERFEDAVRTGADPVGADDEPPT